LTDKRPILRSEPAIPPNLTVPALAVSANG
jgi:hypothetical protein